MAAQKRMDKETRRRRRDIMIGSGVHREKKRSPKARTTGLTFQRIYDMLRDDPPKHRSSELADYFWRGTQGTPAPRRGTPAFAAWKAGKDARKGGDA